MKVTLSEVTTLTPGFAFKSKDFKNGNMPVLKIADIQGQVRCSNVSKVNTDAYTHAKLEKYLVKPGDCLVAMTGNTIGKIGRVSEGAGLINQRVLKINPADNKILDSEYLWGLLQLNSFHRHIINHIDSHSAQPNISASSIGKFSFDLPELNTQIKISKILASIRKKAELNNRINDYLEELCDVIYQDFVNSNDESWRRGTLNELLDIKYGKDHKKLADGPYPVYGSGGYMRSVEKPLANGESVLIPRKGSLNNVMYVNEEFWTVDTMFFTVPRVPGAAKYAFQYIKKLDLESMNSGSAVPSMTTAILNALELPIPDHEALRELDKRFQPMYKLKAANKTEIEQLSALRDAILPKLMSGEIDVSNLDLTQLNNHLCDH